MAMLRRPSSPTVPTNTAVVSFAAVAFLFSKHACAFMVLKSPSVSIRTRLPYEGVAKKLITDSHGASLLSEIPHQLSMDSFSTSSDTSVSTASLFLSHHEATEGAASLLPVVGSSLIMLTIVALLYAWEESVEWVREKVPKSLLPVVESILAEIGGLGFIGLVLQTILGPAGDTLGAVSELFFGEEELLVENFEFLHAAFFQVGVGFFAAAGAMVAVGLAKLEEIETVQGLQLDQESGACVVTAAKLADYVPSSTGKNNEGGKDSKSIWNEINMPKEKRAGLSLLMRHQLMESYPHLPDTFRIETFIQSAFATNLLEMVKLSPLTWIYIIPGLALANAIDLSHDVVNAASPNAAESVGFFYSTPSAIIPSTLAVLLASGWGIVNVWKLTEIKYMLIPRLGKNPSTGETMILPPLVQSDAARKSFDSSPSWIQPVEGFWGQPAKNHYDELFGTAGAAGVDLYRNSIKFQTWLCLTQIVFFGTQIVPRDLNALLTGANHVGDPSHLTAELVTYGLFVLISLFQLLFVSPRAFWNFCLVACVEDKTSEKLLQLSGNGPVPSTEGGSPLPVGANNVSTKA